ncbi:MAG: hypothetical protein HY912_20050 [Desulfomonile tiedjei]|uniref:Uncharacterized protein n=1 Tax=Desulfomonile tiedjei TaxID=2358 RepID=A0A9D6V5B5_9BACT|nr:hypothetical protein [Desulfomonile tiedjei]
MTISAAFFLSPNGHLVHVPQNHISTVIAEPENFGLTREEIEALYREYGERVGVEGKARREILLKIIADGWIRIRRYPNKYWSVTAASLIPLVQDRLREWAGKMLAGINGFKESDRYMPVKVSTASGESLCTIGDLAEGTCPR